MKKTIRSIVAENDKIIKATFDSRIRALLKQLQEDPSDYEFIIARHTKILKKAIESTIANSFSQVSKLASTIGKSDPGIYVKLVSDMADWRAHMAKLFNEYKKSLLNLSNTGLMADGISSARSGILRRVRLLNNYLSSRIYNEYILSLAIEGGEGKIFIRLSPLHSKPDECDAIAGEYKLGQEPQLPIHYNCMCYYERAK